MHFQKPMKIGIVECGLTKKLKFGVEFLLVLYNPPRQ